MNKIFLKRNKYIILAYLVIIVMTFLSIFNYCKDNYIFQYNKIKKVCFEDNNLESDVCEAFTKYGVDLEEYLQDEKNTASSILKSRGFASVSTNIIMTKPYASLQFLSPLLISLAMIGSLHELYSSGMFKNYLQQMSMKKMFKKLYKKTFVIALISPISLIIIYLISGIMTDFQIVYNTNLFQPWFLDNYIFYIISTLIIQYLFNVFCVNLCLLGIMGTKNTILAILKGYLYFVAVSMCSYLLVYGLFLRRILGVKISYEFFNITGFWFFLDNPNYLLIIPELLVFILFSFIPLALKYRNKEKIIISSEMISG